MSAYVESAVQAGTPMTAIGDVSLSPWLETERPSSSIIYSKISRGALIGMPIKAGQSPSSLSGEGIV
jgi:hypothetical protein